MRLASSRLNRWLSGRISTSRLLRLRSGDFESLLYRGQRELEKGRPDAALRLFDLASILWPDDYQPFLGLGVTHLTLGNLDAAATAFTRAHSLAPDDPWSLVNRAEVRLLQGQTDDARLDLDRLSDGRLRGKTPVALTARIEQLARRIADSTSNH